MRTAGRRWKIVLGVTVGQIMCRLFSRFAIFAAVLVLLGLGASPFTAAKAQTTSQLISEARGVLETLNDWQANGWPDDFGSYCRVVQRAYALAEVFKTGSLGDDLEDELADDYDDAPNGYSVCHPHYDEEPGRLINGLWVVDAPPQFVSAALATGGVPTIAWPPTGQVSDWSGMFAGAQFEGLSSKVVTTERSRMTGLQTSQFNDSSPGVGGGFNFGYNLQPGSNVLIGPLFEINVSNADVQHTFGNGAYIGSTADIEGSGLLRVGVLPTPDLLIYGITGISLAAEQLQINFGGVVTNETHLTPGFTYGGGVEVKLPPFRGTSLFVSIEHTDWNVAPLDAPAASPMFDYAWKRQSNLVEGGFRSHW